MRDKRNFVFQPISGEIVASTHPTNGEQRLLISSFEAGTPGWVVYDRALGGTYFIPVIDGMIDVDFIMRTISGIQLHDRNFQKLDIQVGFNITSASGEDFDGNFMAGSNTSIFRTTGFHMTEDSFRKIDLDGNITLKAQQFLSSSNDTVGKCDSILLCFTTII